MESASLTRAAVVQVAVGLALAGSAIPPELLGVEYQDPCHRGPERVIRPGGTLVIPDRHPPCRIVFRPTGVRLESVVDGSRPDPGRTVVMDRNGRFYTANAQGFESVIGVWNARGEFLTSFGRAGEGPGEFREGLLILDVDSRNQLHVRAGPAWLVFSPDHEFLRTRATREPGRSLLDFRRTAILDSGNALTGESYGSDRRQYFRVTTPEGTLDRSFGPVAQAVAESPSRPLDRIIAYDGGETFWAGPRQGDTEGYVVEEWGLDGILLRSIHRPAPWFGWRAEDESYTTALQLHPVRDEGLLYIILQRPTPEGRRAMVAARRERRPIPREQRYGLTEVVVEMIDVRSGELLASETHPTAEAMRFIPPALFRGGRLGYLHGEADNGLPFVEIVAVELEAR